MGFAESEFRRGVSTLIFPTYCSFLGEFDPLSLRFQLCISFVFEIWCILFSETELSKLFRDVFSWFKWLGLISRKRTQALQLPTMH